MMQSLQNFNTLIIFINVLQLYPFIILLQQGLEVRFSSYSRNSNVNGIGFSEVCSSGTKGDQISTFINSELTVFLIQHHLIKLLNKSFRNISSFLDITLIYCQAGNDS